ncbi:hypothetical protein ACP70R_046730 [Stipagrostis hirtigluma subsp. patula]
MSAAAVTLPLSRTPPPQPPLRPQRTSSHPSPPPYLLHASPAASSASSSGLPFLPRATATPPPLVRVSRRQRRRLAAMSDAVSPGASLDTILNISEGVGQNDLLIVGPGVLGRIVADKWKQWSSEVLPTPKCQLPNMLLAIFSLKIGEYPGCKVFGQTATTEHHSELTELGIIPSLKGSIVGPKFPYVIFCAPPYRSDDYPGDLRVAVSNWNGEGSFLFTSSTAVYDCSDNGLCSEDGPCVQIGQSPRTDVLLKAENVVLEDAASLAIAIMKKRLRGRIFVGCDNEPLSRQEIMDRVNRSGKYDTKFQGFTGTDGPLGKRMENSKTRAEIGWQPKYPCFTEFLGLSN